MEIEISEIEIFCETFEIIYSEEIKSKDLDSHIKLYKIELSKYYCIVDILIKTLTLDEQKRAEKYRNINDKNRFIICRSLLRYLLAKESNLDISKIQFEKYDNHKPYLPVNPSKHFNVSHAGKYAIIAIGSCELGVDIEFIDHRFEFTEILPNVFNNAEVNLINNSGNERYLFYKFWTRKEAIVKAIGKGIDDDLLITPVTDGFHSVPSALVCDYKKITAFSFHIDEDYVGAIAFTKDIISLDKIVFYPLPTFAELKNLIFK